MHRMHILAACVAADALFVLNAHRAERHVAGSPSDEILQLGLELLPHGPGRLLVAGAAFHGLVTGIGRSRGMEADRCRHRNDRCGNRHDHESARQTGDDLESIAGRMGR